MKLFEGWTWQKWLGKLAPIISSLLTEGIWAFLELPAPLWAAGAAGALTVVVQWIISLVKSKAA